MIEATDVSVFAGRRALLDRASLRVDRGELVAVVGPNGAGKTTLLSVLAGDREPHAGVATIASRNVRAWRPRELARVRAVLPQHSTLAFGLTALDVALLGCTPHDRGRDANLRAAVAALAAAGASHLRDRSYPTLSGGEKQRVQLARPRPARWRRPACYSTSRPPASTSSINTTYCRPRKRSRTAVQRCSLSCTI